MQFSLIEFIWALIVSMMTMRALPLPAKIKAGTVYLPLFGTSLLVLLVCGIVFVLIFILKLGTPLMNNTSIIIRVVLEGMAEISGISWLPLLAWFFEGNEWGYFTVDNALTGLRHIVVFVTDKSDNVLVKSSGKWLAAAIERHISHREVKKMIPPIKRSCQACSSELDELYSSLLTVAREQVRLFHFA